MAGVRLRAEDKSYSGVEWKWEIWDEDWTGSITDVHMKSGQIKWMQEGDEILEPIKSSSAELVIYQSDDYDTAFDGFVDQLVLGEELRFKMRVYKDSSLYWVGNIITDNCSWDNNSKPYEFVFSAVDGIGRLKEIEMVVDEYHTTGRKTTLEHIRELLDKSDITQFWSSTDVMFKDTVNWYEDRMQTKAKTDSPLLQSGFFRNIFTKDRKDKTKRYTYYECLEGILKMFAARIMLIDGVFRIDQVSAFEDASVDERSIQKNLTIASSPTITPRQSIGSDLRILAGGEYGYFPGLYKVKGRSNNVNSVVSGTFDNNQILDYSNDSSNKVNCLMGLGDIESTGEERVEIAINMNESFDQNPLSTQMVLEMEIEFQLGTRDLQNLNAINYEPEPEWINNPVGTRSYRTKIIPDSYEYNGKQHSFRLVTPVMPPGTHTNCSINIDLWVSYLYSGSGLSGLTGYKMKLGDVVCTVINDGEKVKQREYEVDNAAGVDNSVMLDKGEFLMASTALNFYNTSLLYKNSSSDWEIATSWNKIGTGAYTTNKRLPDLVCHEAMALQNKPVIKMEQTILNGTEYPDICYPVVYDGMPWIFNGGTLNTTTDELKGEWFRLIISRSTPQAGDGKDLGDELDFEFGKPLPQREGKDMVQELMSYRSPTRMTAALTPGTITSIPCEALVGDLIKDGDTIELINPQTWAQLETFEVSADTSDGDTSISVTSKATTQEYYAGAIIRVASDKELKAAEELRGNLLNITSGTLPSSSGDTMGKPGDVVIDESNAIIFVKGTTGWLKIIGGTFT